jgi:hypothetical protein
MNVVFIGRKSGREVGKYDEEFERPHLMTCILSKLEWLFSLNQVRTGSQKE